MRRALCFVAVAICGASTAGARLIDFEEVWGTDSVRFVTVCGSWQHEDNRGFFRLTEAYMFGQSFFYAQWMYDPTSTQNTGAIATASLISDDHEEIELSNIRCEEKQDGVRVLADAYDGHEQQYKRMELDLSSSPGKYNIRFVLR
jgi:hypothetical protein